jgi:Amt family ammonium transporter
MDGLFMGGGFKALGVQALGVCACVAFTAVAMGIVFKLIALTVGLRVSHETELRGLDQDEHGLDSYAGFQIFHTD